MPIEGSDDEKEYERQRDERKEKRRKMASCVQKVGTVVSEGLEKLFYSLGYAIASRPWTVVLCTFFVSALFGLGMIRFELKDSSEPIWIPEDSDVLKNQRWVEDNFQLKYRYNMYIITAENILSPAVIKQMYLIDREVKNLVEVNNTEDDVLNFNWSSICIRLSEECWSNSLLELWSFDEEEIGRLQSVDDVVEKIATTPQSPVYQFDFTPTNWLGDVTYDDDGRIIKARAAKMLYVIQATSTDEMNTKIIAPDLLWEKRFVELGLKLGKELSGPIHGVDVSAVRSFRDESDNSFDGDVMLLMAGVGVIVAYVAVILGKFNEVEHKVYLALVGVFGIGLASLVSYGFASAIGMFYGPIHPILPFLLLGLGVDDMFVIIEAWNNLTALQKRKDLRVKVAIAMQHAGVSITVTSITDFVAFAIGASTTLPALKSFCVYAALGILSLFIIQSTFFVAWLTIDQRRQDASRDACCIWIKYVNFVPNRCSERIFLPWFLRRFFAPFLVSLPIKVLVVSLLAGMLAISSYGSYLLKTDSDLAWFLPSNSYFARFLTTQDRYFDKGIAANLYLGELDYYKSHAKLANMTSELNHSRFIAQKSIMSWHSDFNTWLGDSQLRNIANYIGVDLDEQNYPKDEVGYYKLLNVFVTMEGPGRQYYTSLKWNNTNPREYRQIEASKISFTVKDLPSNEEDVASLEFFEYLSEKYFPGKSFVWSVGFRNWETNRVIQRELYVNIGLAFVAVFVVTLLLVANLLTCTLVCLCVIFTLINVCGFMHFWGLTIDTLTSILLILSIGLAIDYSAHIGHTFMTINGARDERAQYTVSTIGPAVINGGFSTFLAFILLATSNSYIFTTFFKVFFLVVIFGLYNGICVLPVLLSWFGPPPYLNATRMALTSKMSIRLKTLTKSNVKESQQVHSSHLKTVTHMESVIIENDEDISDVNPAEQNKDFANNTEFAASSSVTGDRIDLLNSTSPMAVDIHIGLHNFNTSRPAAEPGPPLTCEEIIKDCEAYLLEESNNNRTDDHEL